MKPTWIVALIWTLSTGALASQPISVELAPGWSRASEQKPSRSTATSRLRMAVTLPASFTVGRPSYVGNLDYHSTLVPGLEAHLIPLTFEAAGSLRVALGTRFWLLSRDASVGLSGRQTTETQSLVVAEVPLGVEWIPSWPHIAALQWGVGLSFAPAGALSARTAVGPSEWLNGYTVQSELFFLLGFARNWGLGQAVPRLGVQLALYRWGTPSEVSPWENRWAGTLGVDL